MIIAKPYVISYLIWVSISIGNPPTCNSLRSGIMLQSFWVNGLYYQNINLARLKLHTDGFKSFHLPRSEATASPSYLRQPLTVIQLTMVPDLREHVRFSGSICPLVVSNSTLPVIRTTGRDLKVY